MALEIHKLYRLHYNGEPNIDQEAFEDYIRKTVPDYDIKTPRTWPFIPESELIKAYGKYDGTLLLPRFAAYDVSVMNRFASKNKDACVYHSYALNMHLDNNSIRKSVQMTPPQHAVYCSFAYFWSYLVTLNSPKAAALAVTRYESALPEVPRLTQASQEATRKCASLQLSIESANREIRLNRWHTSDYQSDRRVRVEARLKANTTELRDTKRREVAIATNLDQASKKFKQAKEQLVVLQKRLKNGQPKHNRVDEQAKSMNAELENSKTLLDLAKESMKKINATLRGTKAELAQAKERTTTLTNKLESTQAELVQSNERANAATNTVVQSAPVDLSNMKERVEAAERQSAKWKKRARDTEKDRDHWQSSFEWSVHTKYAKKEERKAKKQKKRAQNDHMDVPPKTESGHGGLEETEEGGSM